MISDTASYSDDVFTLHIAIMSCIAICAFPRSPTQIYYPMNPWLTSHPVPVFVVFTCYGHRAES